MINPDLIAAVQSVWKSEDPIIRANPDINLRLIAELVVAIAEQLNRAESGADGTGDTTRHHLN